MRRADINMRMGNGETPLDIAGKHGRGKMEKYLEDRRAGRLGRRKRRSSRRLGGWEVEEVGRLGG